MQKGRKAYSSTSKYVTDQPWCIICSLHKTLMSKTFPQESSEAFLNLKSLHWAEQKKNSPAFFNRVLWKALRKKDIVSFGFSKKEPFGTLPPLLNKPMGFMTKPLEKTVHRQCLAKYSQTLVAKILRFGFIGTYTFFLNSV